MDALEAAIDDMLGRSPQNSNRQQAVANYVISLFASEGLAGARGGSTEELRIPGFARHKDWDVAYEYAGKPRLLVSLKSVQANAAGSIPNRLDDLMGESANAQQMSPELVIGYVLLFNTKADSRRQEDGRLWSEYFRERLARIAVRKAPLWNQGLIEALWFVHFDSDAQPGQRVQDLAGTIAAGRAFVQSLLAELHLREPAVPITNPTGTPNPQPVTGTT